MATIMKLVGGLWAFLGVVNVLASPVIRGKDICGFQDKGGAIPEYVCTTPDPSTYQDALDILANYRITPPTSIANHLSNGAKGLVSESLKSEDLVFSRVENHLIATAQASLKSAADFFQQRGITPVILGDTVTGEAREVAKVYAALALQIKQHHHPFKPPVALISGGECTVTLRSDNNQVARGGRCSEFLLSLGVELNGADGIMALACDTDGIDGSEDNAGAYLSVDAINRARGSGIDAKRQLGQNDAYGFGNAIEAGIGPEMTTYAGESLERICWLQSRTETVGDQASDAIGHC